MVLDAFYANVTDAHYEAGDVNLQKYFVVIFINTI